MSVLLWVRCRLSPCKSVPAEPICAACRAIRALGAGLHRLLPEPPRWSETPPRAHPALVRAAAGRAVSSRRQTERLLELLTTEILHPDSQAPNGVKSHFLEVFLEELTKVGADEVGVAGGRAGRGRAGAGSVPRAEPPPLPQLTADQNLRLIEPFCRVAARTQE